MQPFSELTRKQKSIEVLRWMAVVPAAVIGNLAVRIVAMPLMPSMTARPPGEAVTPLPFYQRVTLPLTLSILTAAAFVVAGSKMAPRQRFVSAIVLAAVWIIYKWLPHFPGGWSFFALAALGSGIALIYVYHTERRRAGYAENEPTTEAADSGHEYP